MNRGISGDNTFGVLARLPQIVSGKPSKIFLMIGINDLKREVPVPVIIENYQRMVAMIRKESPRTRIYLQSVLPVNDSMLIQPFRKVTNTDVQKLNEALQALTQPKHIYYVNLHEVFADEKGQLKKDETPDGLHLKIPSYVAWVNYLQQKKYL
jgi:lysophospholipase L1-like esterase